MTEKITSWHESALLLINAYKAGRLWATRHQDETNLSQDDADEACRAYISQFNGQDFTLDVLTLAIDTWGIGCREHLAAWLATKATPEQRKEITDIQWNGWLAGQQDMETMADLESAAGYHRVTGEITIQQAARLKKVSEQAVRDILRSAARRKELFPSARFVGSSPQRGTWYLYEREVNAWQPRTHATRTTKREL